MEGLQKLLHSTALEKGGASALLADALTIQGTARARLGAGEDSINILRHAMAVAVGVGAAANAGLAAFSLIEEHGARRVLPRTDLYALYQRASSKSRKNNLPKIYFRLRPKTLQTLLPGFLAHYRHTKKKGHP